MASNSFQRTLLLLATATLTTAVAMADTSIVGTENYSWAPNAGWIDWQGDVANGAIINNHYASGFIYGANIGWINLGSGMPLFGPRYSNATADDFGVNVDALSDPGACILSGFAWSANAGWIVFDVAATAGPEYQPRIEKGTGILRGTAYSPNLGWLPLESLGGGDFAILRSDPSFMGTPARHWPLYP